MGIKRVKLEQKKIAGLEFKRISEYLTPDILNLFERLRIASHPLRDVSHICNGLKPYEVSKGSPPQTKKIVENRIFDADVRKDDTYKRYLRGEDFHKYSLNPQEERWISYGEWLAEPRPAAPFFEPEKIVIRQTADTVIAVIDDKGYLNLNNVHNLMLKEKDYSLHFILSLLNSKFLSFFHGIIVPEFGRVFAEVKIVNLGKLPIPKISFNTPENKRRKRVGEVIGLYGKYMLELNQKGKTDGDEIAKKHDRAVDVPVAGRKEKPIHGEHSSTGERVYGLRGRTRKPEDAERVSEEPEEYLSNPRYTRFIESSLGIKSYSELAPELAKGVERVMASLLEKSPDKLNIIPEFICRLHKDAFEGLFPSWAGRYRDRDVKIGDYIAPPYYEVPVLMRSYCDDLEFRLSALDAKSPDTNMLIEAFAFAEGRLLSIHPFQDFNGRVTRMMLFALLYRFDLPPVQLVPDDKDKTETNSYLDALSEADRMNWQPLITVWRKRLGLREGS